MSQSQMSIESNWAAYQAAASEAYAVAGRISGQPSSVEWDHKGRVVRSRFCNGQVCQFRYDQQGCLYAFTYAGLAWSTTDGARWTAVDQEYTYILEGTVDVGIDGCLYIGKTGLRRSIKLNGVITDQLEDGVVVESPRTAAELCPQDLLVVIKPKNCETLSRLTPNRAALETAVPKVVPPCGRENGEPPIVSPSGSSSAPAQAGSASSGRLPSQAVRKQSVKQAERPAAGAPFLVAILSVINNCAFYRRDSALKAIQLSDRYEFTYDAVYSKMRRRLKNILADFKLKLLEKLYGNDSPAIAPSLDLLAEAACSERQIDEAQRLHERALAIRRKALGARHADIGINLYGLGRIAYASGRFTEAEQHYLEAIKLLDNGMRKAIFLHSIEAASGAYLSRHLDRLVLALHSLATMYDEQKQPQLCEQVYQAAVHVCNKVGEPFRQVAAAKLQSMAAMSAHLDTQKRQPDAQRLTKSSKEGCSPVPIKR